VAGTFGRSPRIRHPVVAFRRWCLPVSREPLTGSVVNDFTELPGPTDEPTGTESSIMSGTRKISEAEWQVYKEEIEVLYLTENKSREEVMAAMAKTHGFQARFVDHCPLIIYLTSGADRPNSKAQYIRKFEKWGFKKNSTDENWKYIAQKLQKRNLEGKESDTYVNGKLVPRKRVKKEVSRHFLPSWQIMSIPGMHPANALQFLELSKI
jgi:hypothetical protein